MSIESLEFREIGLGNVSYRYKKVEIIHPAQNVCGLTMINGEYYRKEYDMQVLEKLHHKPLADLIRPNPKP